jgi:hypothetical protein
LKIITNLSSKKYKKFGVICFKDLENIVQFSFLDGNILAVLGQRHLGELGDRNSFSTKKARLISGKKPTPLE